MNLWTDLIDPVTLTGYARQALETYEQSKGTLAQFLPNRTVNDVAVRMVVGDSGLVDEAQFRAFDAEPEVGTTIGGQRVTVDLAAISQETPISEYTQLRSRSATDPVVMDVIKQTTERTVWAIADAVERMRGVVIATGKATIDQINFKTTDDFGRDPGFTTTATKLWSATDSDPVAYLQSLVDLYTEKNGEAPGVMLTSRKVVHALTSHASFATQLANGASRAATIQQVNDQLVAAGLPAVQQYDRRTRHKGSTSPVLPVDHVFLLPAPVAPTGISGLGSTIWGTTLTATEPGFNIAPVDQPGIVTGVFKAQKVPFIAEVIGDAIALPVLANANLSLAAKVL